MRKVILSIGLLLGVCLVSHAQKGKNQINVGPEVDLPLGTLGDAYKVGFGGTIKGLLGVGKFGQITLTTGYLTFKGKSANDGGYSYADQTFGIIPFLAGYRQNFNSIYVEPQIGLASYKTKVTGYSFTETRFTYGLGAGYSSKIIDLGLRFQSHEGASLLALRAAYNINLKSKK